VHLIAVYAISLIGLVLCVSFARAELSEPILANVLWASSVTAFLLTFTVGWQMLLQRSNKKLEAAPGDENLASKLSESQERERIIAEYANDALLCVSKEGKILAANSTPFRLWSVDPANLIDRDVRSFAVDEEGKIAIASIERTLAEAGQSSFEFRMLLPNGRLVDCHWHCEYSRTDDVLYCVITDISERKAIERLRQQLMSMLGHDLRAPLSSVKVALAAVARDTSLSGESQGTVSRATGSLDRVIALCSDLLDLQQCEQGQLALKEQLVSVAELIEETVDEFRDQIAEQNQSISLQLSPGFINADEDRIKQVIANLLSNAAKYGGENSRIEVRMRDESDGLELSVEDSGPGISVEDTARLFQPYVQLNPEAGKGGTGLGLSLCKYIVEAHGGRIGVRRSDLGGACVWLRLPKLIS